MIRDVNLIEHLPLFIQEYREIQQTMSAENPELQLVTNESEIMKNNQFIQTCDLTGIVKFERLLSVIPSVNDTLETRRFRVLSRWNNNIPFTWKALLEKLDALCGDSNYTIELLNNLYKINLVTHFGTFGSIDELKYMLNKVIPANIQVLINNVLVENKETESYHACCAVSSMSYTIY